MPGPGCPRKLLSTVYFTDSRIWSHDQRKVVPLLFDRDTPDRHRDWRSNIYGNSQNCRPTTDAVAWS